MKNQVAEGNVSFVSRNESDMQDRGEFDASYIGLEDSFANIPYESDYVIAITGNINTLSILNKMN